MESASVSFEHLSGFYQKLNGPTIQAGTSSESAPLLPNYIDLMLNAPSFDVIQAKWIFPGSQAARAALCAVAPFASVRVLKNGAANLAQPDPNAFGAGWIMTREQELDTTSGLTPTFTQLMNQPINGVTTTRAADFLHTLRTSADPNIAPRVSTLLETRDSLAYLKTLSTGRLQRAFAGTLDL